MKNSKLLRLIGILGGSALLVAGFFFYFGTFASADGHNLISGTQLAFGTNGLFGTKPVPGILTAWIFSLLLLLSAAAAITLYALDLAGIFHLKLLDKQIVRFGLSACVGCLAGVTAILLFCTLPLSEFDINGVGLGASAVLGGISTLLGGCALSFGIAVPAMK